MTPDYLAIDKRLPTPAYLQLGQQLARAIDTAILKPGTALPSERDLSEQLGLSRMTVRRAFEELAQDGLIEQRQGSGTYVKARPVEQVIDRVLGFTDEARHLGFSPGSRLIESTMLAPDDTVRRALELEPGSEVLRVTRLRTADSEPLAVQVAWLPTALASLSLDVLRKNGSLYKTIAKQFDRHPARARQTIGARLPTRRECSLLEIPRDVPVLALERTTFDTAGAPFEFVRSAYRGDRYRMALDLRAPDA